MRKLPWTDYALRVLCAGLMFVSGFLLLSMSTFALRMRNDIPGFVPGLDGPQSLALVLSLALALLPLAMGRAYLGALAASAFVLSGLGGYWWTTIPWDELITASDFPASGRPTLLDYLLVASPALVLGFYAVASQHSRLRADLLNRGASRTQARRAACASFLSGAALFALTTALAGALWALMASGAVFRVVAPIRGVAAIVIASALGVVAYALIARRVRPDDVKRLREEVKPPVKRPSTDEGRRGVLARIRARRWPS